MNTPINLTITALLSAFSYVTLVSLFNSGVGLGEPMWQGYLNQVIFHFIFTFIALIAIITPLYFLLKRLTGNKALLLVITSLFIFFVLVFLYVFIVSVDGYWLGVLLPCVVGVLTFTAIEYLTNRSRNGSR